MDGNINAALLLINRALSEIETEFLPCVVCDHTTDIDQLTFIDDLKGVKHSLEQFVAKSQK